MATWPCEECGREISWPFAESPLGIVCGGCADKIRAVSLLGTSEDDAGGAVFGGAANVAMGHGGVAMGMQNVAGGWNGHALNTSATQAPK
jgi:hypothetical protein